MIAQSSPIRTAGTCGASTTLQRGDVILNPFEARSARWDLFGEISDDYDVEQLARSLIPDHEGADRSWRGYARTFFSAVTAQAHAAGSRDVRELYRLLVVAGTAGTEDAGGRHAGAALSRGAQRAHVRLDPLGDELGGRRTRVRRAPAQRAALGARVGAQQRRRRRPRRRAACSFLPYRAGQIAALRSTISAWMRLAIFEAMNREEGEQRLWFVVDELDALGQIDEVRGGRTSTSPTRRCWHLQDVQQASS